ncbi:hypothetical protein DTO027B9_6779 [Paecilomyces variotii]|nr:hypothetical protein DTO027B9_6779 [Paecilomyces variotii]
MARETITMENFDDSTGSDIPPRPSREKRRSHGKHRRHKSRTRDTTLDSPDPTNDAGLVGLLQDLNDGVLTTKSRMRAFTTFLDIKNEYHSEFLKNLWGYVNKNRCYDWEKLRRDEKVRRVCATTFVDHFGQKYWGEKSRARYLMEGSLERPENLCVYPQRKEVMIRAVTLLLEKKSSSREVLQTGSGGEGDVAPVTESAISETVLKARKSKKKDAKRASYHERLTPEFGTPEIVQNMGLPLWEPPYYHTEPNTPDDEGEDVETFAEIESKYMRQTTFLLSTDTEQEMFPVHIPFHRFSRVSAFFTSMMDECVLNEKDDTMDTMQIDDESNTDGQIGRILAASVGFEWCGYKILVRPGKEDDWKRVIAQLREEWLLRDLGTKEVPYLHEVDYFCLTVPAVYVCTMRM